MFFSQASRPSAATLALGLAIIDTFVTAGPCDIYSSGGTPCVAAHSTTRALYSGFSGSLYQLIRGSDNAVKDVGVLSTGGVANAATQDSFCASTTCLISIIYDQSGHNNHLTQAPPGSASSGATPTGDYLAGAFGAPVTLNGKKAYGVFISPGTGYRNDRPTGTATGDAPEGIYAVFDGTHFNNGCCFDYGNAETNAGDNGNGHMEAIYFGLGTGFGTGAGSGPWILADFENGLFAQDNTGVNPNDPTQTARFLTAVVKGEPSQWALRGGDATGGSLTTYYSGERPPNGYNPMHKEGAIILGIGGDNSNQSQGTFYEGVMTTGYPSDGTENSVQQDIRSAGYATTSLVTAPLTVGSTLSFQATTPCCTSDFIAHTGATVNIQPVTSSSPLSLRQQASWRVRTGLGFSGCYSFESVDSPGSFIRHYNYELMVDANDGSMIFGTDATFCTQPGLNGQGDTFRSWSYPSRYWRHYNLLGYIASEGGPHDFDAPGFFNDDVSFIVAPGFAS